MASVKIQLKMSERLIERLDEASQWTGIERTELVHQMIEEGIARRAREGEWRNQPSKNAAGHSIAARWVPDSGKEEDTFWTAQARRLVKALWMWSTTPRAYKNGNAPELENLVQELQRKAENETIESTLATELARSEMETGVSEDDIKMLRSWGKLASIEATRDLVRNQQPRPGNERRGWKDRRPTKKTADERTRDPIEPTSLSELMGSPPRHRPGVTRPGDERD